MSIRCAAKAIIIKDECILLNRCVHEDGTVYYDLPGGGQHQYESMEQAVIREVKEETGYDVSVLRFAAVAEEIYMSESLRRQYPDYTHRIMHIFLVKIAGEEKVAPTEKDFGMDDSVWVPINEVNNLPEICPSSLRQNLQKILESEAVVYLGTEHTNWEKE